MKRTVHLSHGYNQFDAIATPVPAGYRKDTSFPRDWAIQYHCRPPNPIPTHGRNETDWIHEMKNKRITIADIKRLKPGQHIDVLLLDRNYKDILDAKAAPNKAQKATTLFAHNKARYIQNEGLKGRLEMLDDIVLDPFEFHVAVENGWYPLTNGILPSNDPQGFITLYGKPIHWQDMPTNTAIGFRGEMLPWSLVTKAPPLFWYSP